MGAVMIRTVLRLPGVPAMAAWSFAGRVGFGMLNLSLLLFVAARSGSYATAGAMSAVSLLGTAVGTVVQGRVMDRYGPSRPLLVLALPHAMLAAGVVLGISTAVQPVLLAVLIFAQCAVLPAVAVASRSMWPHLVPSERTRGMAYNYEAMSFELCWLLGPAVSGLLATALWPGSALVVSCALATVAAIGFARTAAVRSNKGARAVAGSTGTVDRGGLAVLLTATTGFGLGIGFVVVGVTAGTAANGVPQLSGVLLAAWTISSLLGGLAYQRRPWPPVLVARLPVLLSAFGLFLLIAVPSGGVVALSVAVVLAGLTLVPQVTTHNTVLDGLVGRSRLTEAYGWITTTIAVANAAGQAAGGLVVDSFGHRTGFLTATVCVLALALVVWTGRQRLHGSASRAT